MSALTNQENESPINLRITKDPKTIWLQADLPAIADRYDIEVGSWGDSVMVDVTVPVVEGRRAITFDLLSALRPSPITIELNAVHPVKITPFAGQRQLFPRAVDLTITSEEAKTYDLPHGEPTSPSAADPAEPAASAGTSPDATAATAVSPVTAAAGTDSKSVDPAPASAATASAAAASATPTGSPAEKKDPFAHVVPAPIVQFIGLSVLIHTNTSSVSMLRIFSEGTNNAAAGKPMDIPVVEGEDRYSVPVRDLLSETFIKGLNPTGDAVNIRVVAFKDTVGQSFGAPKKLVLTERMVRDLKTPLPSPAAPIAPAPLPEPKASLPAAPAPAPVAKKPSAPKLDRVNKQGGRKLDDGYFLMIAVDSTVTKITVAAANGRSEPVMARKEYDMPDRSSRRNIQTLLPQGAPGLDDGGDSLTFVVVAYNDVGASEPSTITFNLSEEQVRAIKRTRQSQDSRPAEPMSREETRGGKKDERVDALTQRVDTMERRLGETATRADLNSLATDVRRETGVQLQQFGASMMTQIGGLLDTKLAAALPKPPTPPNADPAAAASATATSTPLDKLVEGITTLTGAVSQMGTNLTNGLGALTPETTAQARHDELMGAIEELAQARAAGTGGAGNDPAHPPQGQRSRRRRTAGVATVVALLLAVGLWSWHRFGGSASTAKTTAASQTQANDATAAVLKAMEDQRLAFTKALEDAKRQQAYVPPALPAGASAPVSGREGETFAARSSTGASEREPAFRRASHTVTSAPAERQSFPSIHIVNNNVNTNTLSNTNTSTSSSGSSSTSSAQSTQRTERVRRGPSRWMQHGEGQPTSMVEQQEQPAQQVVMVPTQAMIQQPRSSGSGWSNGTSALVGATLGYIVGVNQHHGRGH